MLKGISRKYIALFSLIVVFCLSTAAFGIGQWHNGAVTKAPWKNKYTYIRIDRVKYMIMASTVVKELYTENGVTHHDPSFLSNVQKGSNVRFVSEGNRIYRIEILQ